MPGTTLTSSPSDVANRLQSYFSRKLLKTIEDDSIESLRAALIEVALQGADTEGERLIFEALIERIDGIMVVLSELRMLGEKCLKG